MNRQQYEFLERGLGENTRPVLTWGHVGQWDDEYVAWTANGYSLHMVWGVTPGICGMFPFRKSVAMKEGAKVPNGVDLMRNSDPAIKFEVGIDKLRQALAGFIHSRDYSAVTLISHRGRVFLTSKTSVYDLAETDGGDGVIAFNANLMRSAIPTKSGITQICFNAHIKDAEDLPLRMGHVGIAAAVIMPMAGFHHQEEQRQLRKIYRMIDVSLEEDEPELEAV